MMMDLSQPPAETGLRRAFYEMAIAISAQKAMDEMQRALMAHMMTAFSARLLLELAPTAEAFAHGGLVGHA
jgi:hypothetical protein